MDFGDILSSLSGIFGGGGGGGGGITYPPPTATSDPNAVTGLPGYPATPDIYPGTNTTMPPGTSAATTPPFNPWSLLPAAVGGIGSIIGLARGQGSATDKALKRQAASTQGLANVGNQALQSYSTGQLSPAGQEELKRQMAQIDQQLASMGISDSTIRAQMINAAQTNLFAKEQQQYFNNAYQAIGLNQGNLADLARQQAVQDAEQRKAWADFMAAMGKLGTDIAPIFT